MFKLNRGSPVAAVAKGNPQSEAAHFDHLELWREAPPQASKKQKTFNSTLISCIWVCLRIGRLISFGSSSLVLFFNGLKWWASSSVFRHTHHLIMIGRLIIGFSQEAKLWHRTISQHKESVFHPLCCASGFRWEGLRFAASNSTGIPTVGPNGACHEPGAQTGRRRDLVILQLGVTPERSRLLKDELI